MFLIIKIDLFCAVISLRCLNCQMNSRKIEIEFLGHCLWKCLKRCVIFSTKSFRKEVFASHLGLILDIIHVLLLYLNAIKLNTLKWIELYFETHKQNNDFWIVFSLFLNPIVLRRAVRKIIRKTNLIIYKLDHYIDISDIISQETP